MKYICVDQMLSEKPIPDYEEIITKLKKTIEIVEKEPQYIFVNWLGRSKSKASKQFGLFD